MFDLLAMIEEEEVEEELTSIDCLSVRLAMIGTRAELVQSEGG